MKKNDIYHFNYNEEERAKEGYPGSLNHCFDGQLVAREEDERLILKDTYWSFGNSGDGRYFITKEEAEKKGTLKFICNLDEVEKIEEQETVYYADKDLFNLSYQHNCYKFYAKKKGAKRSPEKMLKELNDRIQEEKRNIDYSVRKIEQLTENKTKLEAGDTEIYI